jgi:hypothetical protein
MSPMHEFDVPLTQGTATQFSPTRAPANELHINAWALGTKGSPTIQVGNFSNVGSISLTMSTARAGVALTNAPFELIIGDVSGALVNNLTEWGAIASTTGENLSGIYFF